MINGTRFIKPLGYVGAGLGGAALGATTGYALARRKTKKRRTKNKRTYSKGHKKRARGTSKKHRKYTSHRKIRYTTKGQPYFIMSSGKARFIKKKSAKLSKKRKGGRY